MNWIKYRFAFFLGIVLLLVDMNRKTDDNPKTIGEFKFEMLGKIYGDTLGTGHRLGLVLNETARFVDESSYVRGRIRYVVIALVFLVVIEAGFSVIKKRNSAGSPKHEQQ